MTTPRHRAFTIIELIVSVAIIALMVSILLPTLGQVRDAGKASVCLSNQRQTLTALMLYTVDYDGRVAPNRQVLPGPPTVHRWWFGESTTLFGLNRDINKMRSPLAPYFNGDILTGLACPSFPFDDERFLWKFAQSSAHFGYNVHVAPFDFMGIPPKRIQDVPVPDRVIMFADAIHSDGLYTAPNGQFGFYEPHYLGYTTEANGWGGRAHFRHAGVANVAWLDGHASTREPADTALLVIAGSKVANLDTSAGPDSVYGF